MTSNPSTSPIHTHPTPDTTATTTHSCLRCRKRKVRCDRRHPCQNCVKHKAECEFVDPGPRKKRKRRESAGQDGVDASRGQALKGTSDVAEEKELEDAQVGQGRLVVAKGGRSIYLENNLWRTVGNELQDDECMFPEDSSAEESDQRRALGQTVRLDEASLLFGAGSKYYDLAAMHPNPVGVFKLWQVFLENVNPLTKIIHAPTLQQRILDASGDLGSVPKDIEALMFAIYSAALTSLDDDEVLQSFGESRDKLLALYRQGTQRALVNAGLLSTSSMMVLQALVVFIISGRVVYDPHTLWSLSGIGVRIAQRIGLHRDGSLLGLSIFETEMRRRLWWQVMVTDAVAGEKSGSPSLLNPLADTQTPLNINDSDLDPEMQETPPEATTNRTEMIFCLMRYELGRWLGHHSKSKSATSSGLWEPLRSMSIAFQEKDRMIKELEETLESKYIRFCDPSIPLHLMTMLVAKSIGPMLRLQAHHPRLYHRRGESPTQFERDLLFDACISVAEHSNTLLILGKTRRYLWHAEYHFPWDAVLYLLSELRHRTNGGHSAKAWQLIDVNCTRQYQELGPRAVHPLHRAIAVLGVKAWAAHVRECERRCVSSLPQPEIVSIFCRLTRQTAQPAWGSGSSLPTSLESTGPGANSLGGSGCLPQTDGPFDEQPPTDPVIDFGALAEVYPPDESPIDWGEWDVLLQQYREQELPSGIAYLQ